MFNFNNNFSNKKILYNLLNFFFLALNSIHILKQESLINLNSRYYEYLALSPTTFEIDSHSIKL